MHRYTSSRQFRAGVWIGFAIAAALLCLWALAGCASDPKPRATMDAAGLVAEGPANRSVIVSPGATASANGSTPTGTGQFFGPSGPTLAVSQPSPTDMMRLEALGADLALTNTVEIDAATIDFQITDAGDSTIERMSLQGFRTKPPDTVRALAEFQTAWNTFAVNADNATKEAFNEATRQWAETIRAVAPTLADLVLKAFMVP